MKVIALCGNPQTGKTTTIKHLIDNLNFKGATKVYSSKTGAKVNDYSIILNYQGKIVAITTFGDSPSMIWSNYKRLKEKIMESPTEKKCKIDVFVCASHFSRQALAMLFDIAKNGNPNVPVCEPIVVLKPDVDTNLQATVIHQKALEIEQLI